MCMYTYCVSMCISLSLSIYLYISLSLYIYIYILSCAIYTHTPARKSSTNFQQYYFVIQFRSTNWLGHGHGYKWHSSIIDSASEAASSAPRLQQLHSFSFYMFLFVLYFLIHLIFYNLLFICYHIIYHIIYFLIF